MAGGGGCLTWNITDGVPLAAETGDENFVLHKRQALHIQGEVASKE